MEYKDGDILYVCNKKTAWRDGFLAFYKGTHQGTEDLSHHGSPWYEDFLDCQDIETGEMKSCGSRTYCWCDAKGYIKSLQNVIDSVKKIVRYS